MTGEPCALWQEFYKEKTPALKEQLVMDNLSLIGRIVNKMAGKLPAHISKDDLYSCGVFGLLEAVERYNPNLGVEFAAYASKRIKGAIIDNLRKEDWVPTSIRKKAKIVEEAYTNLENRLGRSATDAEIAESLHISTEQLGELLSSLQYITVISLDEPIREEEELRLKDSIVDEKSPDPQMISEAKEIKKTLALAVDGLPEKERLVVSLFYFHDLSNKEIAQVLELSESRISQLHTKAILRLRGKLARMRKNL